MLVVVMNKPWAYSSLNINGNMMLAQTDPKIFIDVYAWVGTSPSTWQIPGWMCSTYKYPICGIQAELTWYLLRDYKYRVPLLDSHYSEQLHCLSSRGKRRKKTSHSEALCQVLTNADSSTPLPHFSQTPAMSTSY